MELTSDDAIFGCVGNLGGHMRVLDDKDFREWGVLALVIQLCSDAALAARL